MSVAADVKKIFEKLPDTFLPEKAGNTNAIIQIELSGEGASNWVINIAQGKMSVKEGVAPSPTMTLQMEASDYVALAQGRANPMELFAAGKVKFQGDMGLALKFQQMFSRGE
jgi:putative sterol carrier protein